MLGVMVSTYYEGYSETSPALKFVRKGGIKLAINAMKENESQLPIMKCGLNCLFYFSTNTENCVDIMKQGGIQVTLDIMKKYPNLVLLQESGMYVLCNIAANGTRDLQKNLGESGAIELLTQVVTNYENLPKLSLVCGLSCMAEYPPNRSKIAACGWISTAIILLEQEYMNISQFHFLLLRFLAKMTATHEQKLMGLLIKDLAKWCQYLLIPDIVDEKEKEKKR